MYPKQSKKRLGRQSGLQGSGCSKKRNTTNKRRSPRMNYHEVTSLFRRSSSADIGIRGTDGQPACVGEYAEWDGKVSLDGKKFVGLGEASELKKSLSRPLPSMRNEDSSCGHILTTEEKRIRFRESVAFSREHKLKKCPHCGRYPHGWHSRHVTCRCGASMDGDNAYRSWNRRAKTS